MISQLSDSTTVKPALIPLAQATDPAEIGHKAATLAALLSAGLPVPDGVVVPMGVISGVGAGDLPDDLVLALADTVRGWGDVPVAVRSSSIAEDLPHASYAGLYTTVLNVRGEKSLREAVLRCWTSARAPEVIAYTGEVAAPGLAVLVQPMVAAVAAGVAFTADPVTGDRGVVVIDAVRGLGEQLVSGAVTPDRWEVRAEARRLPTAPGGTPTIDAATACAIAALARRTEDLLGVPQDVEWALSGNGTLVLLQARPVTTLAGEPVPLIPLPVEPPEGYWVREASHAPLPWTAFTHAVFEARNRGIRQMCTELGLLFETVEMRNIGGWEYLRIVPLGGKEPPPLPSWTAPLAFRPVPSLRRRIRSSVAAIRCDVPGALIRCWVQEWQPDLAAQVVALRDVDLDGLDDTELDEHLREVLTLTEHGQLIHFRLHGAIAMVLGELAFTCRDLLGWDEAKTLNLLAGTSQMSTAPARALAAVAALARQCPALRQLIEDGVPAQAVLAADERFAAAFEAYQREYGCRALRYEIAEPCLDEQPDLVLALIRDQLVTRFDPDAAEETLRARRAATRAEAERLLGAQSSAQRARFDRALDRALIAYPVREDNEFFTTSAPFALARRAAREVGRRLAARGLLASSDDAFCLSPDQLRAALRDGIDCHALATRRAGERAWALSHPGPASYGRPPGPPPPLRALPAQARLANEAFLWNVEQILGPHATDTDHGQSDAAGADAAQLCGVPACAGSYTGPARIIRSEGEFHRIRPGDVLVCPVTSPVWSVLFPSIGALVTDTGGMLSHPAIIAREYRLPAVVATGEGTSRLTDGQIVTVDGTAGVVRAFR
ncbi:MAG: PEP-utilizing enzyme [Actinomycetota bacterium]|nr:PEP-utilizing enzyme [Actinomycetota bacterium]